MRFNFALGFLVYISAVSMAQAIPLSVLSAPIPLTVVEVKADGSTVDHPATVSMDPGKGLSATLKDPRMVKILDENLETGSDEYGFWFYLAALKSRWCKNPENFKVSIEVRDMQKWFIIKPGSGFSWDTRVKETWSVTGISFEGCQEPMPQACHEQSKFRERGSFLLPQFQVIYDECVKALSGKYPPFSSIPHYLDEERPADSNH